MRKKKLDESTPGDDESGSINVGMHRVSSQIEADGSAEAVLSNNTTVSSLFATTAPMTRTMSTPLDNTSIPLSRTKSNPLGGISYTMRRVLSRDDRGSRHDDDDDDAVVSQQESEGLVNSRVKGIYNRGDIETILDNDLISPPPLVKRKSSLSAYSMRKIFSKQHDDEWNGEVKDIHQENNRTSLQSGYGLRQVNSTPLQGMENGYALKRTRTTGYEQQQHQQQSSLYQEEQMHNPISLVRSRLSSIGQKVTGGKEVGREGNNNDDDLSTIAESIESSSNTRQKKKKKKRRSKYFIYQLLFAGMMISSGIAGAGVYLLKTDDDKEDISVDVSSVVMGAGEGGGSTFVVEGSSGSSVGEDIGLKVPEATPDEDVSVEDKVIIVKDEGTVDEDITVADEDIVVEDEGTVVNDGDIIIEDEGIVEIKDGTANNEYTIVEESKEAPTGDESSLSSVVDATPKVESSASNVTTSTADGDAGEEEATETIAADVTADVVDSIPTTTVPATSGVVDATSNLESAVSNVTNSTVDMNADEEEAVETIAANVIPTATVPAKTTTATPPPPLDTITSFYVMADAPYTDNERYNLMPMHIEELDDDVDFLVHLGDLSWAKVDKCREGAYDEASTIMKKSRIPTFILPGDNDINDCNSMTHGEEMWTKYFASFDKQYDHSLNVTRWGKLNESFSFIHKEVLYLGLNIIGGRPASNSEKSFRHSQHLERIRTIMNDQLDDFKVVVLLGHAEPTAFHSDFFGGDSGFISIMEEMGKPTIHFHGDWHAYYEREAEYGFDNYMRISLDGESSAPPILVTIDTSKTNPVKFDRRSRNLEVACCSEGWPRYDGKVVNTPRPN
ncbi:hypothetical protein QTG54_007974 [Skeletonema marinoi]|uniref:Calcineurin-like phosphoesterase domain-containing protein n=1 Tax=Skeletonema marinoi TaxID=267567 RepID=A0AAD8Y9Z7_9STRA|nr:hypothetical protein QTG54_007974 [Skeletonema marinoi]